VSVSTIHPVARGTYAASLVLAPAAGIVAAVAVPGLQTSSTDQLEAIAAHPGRFQAYALAILVSSYLLVPEFLALMQLVRQRSPRWSYVAGGPALVGMLVAIGDAATELMYGKMGSAGDDLTTMAALSDRYESGTAFVYAVGGLAFLLGTGLMGVALWRTRVVRRWVAVGLPASAVLNIGGFAAASQPVLVLSYVVMLAVLARAAACFVGVRAPAPGHLVPSYSDAPVTGCAGYASFSRQARTDVGVPRNGNFRCLVQRESPNPMAADLRGTTGARGGRERPAPTRRRRPRPGRGRAGPAGRGSGRRGSSRCLR